MGHYVRPLGKVTNILQFVRYYSLCQDDLYLIHEKSQSLDVFYCKVEVGDKSSKSVKLQDLIMVVSLQNI